LSKLERVYIMNGRVIQRNVVVLIFADFIEVGAGFGGL